MVVTCLSLLFIYVLYLCRQNGTGGDGHCISLIVAVVLGRCAAGLGEIGICRQLHFICRSSELLVVAKQQKEFSYTDDILANFVQMLARQLQY